MNCKMCCIERGIKMSKELSLYNITNKFIELFEKSEEGELTEQELQEEGTELALALKNKGTSIIAYTKNTESLIDAMKNEEKRIAENRKVLENKLDRFKTYVKENMQRLEIQKLESELGTLSIAKNPASVEILDESLIPDGYKKEKVTITVDKTAIKNDLKAGKNIQGVRLIEDKTTLKIK